MTSPIDPIRGPRRVRRTRRATDTPDEGAGQVEGSNLPVPVGPAVTLPPNTPVANAGAIEAQLLGQTGARRGLRAGPTVMDVAKHSYNKTEWSGEKDRRTPKGRVAKTDV